MWWPSRRATSLEVQRRTTEQDRNRRGCRRQQERQQQCSPAQDHESSPLEAGSKEMVEREGVRSCMGNPVVRGSGTGPRFYQRNVEGVCTVSSLDFLF